MALVKLQVKNIVALGLWDKVCKYKGWSEWILNEGRISDDEWIDFDDAFEKPKEKFKYLAKFRFNTVEFTFYSDVQISEGEVIQVDDKTYYVESVDYDNDVWLETTKIHRVYRTT